MRCLRDHDGTCLGLMDVSAYVPPWVWRLLLEERNVDVAALRDKYDACCAVTCRTQRRIGGLTMGCANRRYDAVVHLVTAADGAEQFYTTSNNAARTETPQQVRLCCLCEQIPPAHTTVQARSLDQKVRQSWVGHHNMTIVDNSTSFKMKVNRVANAVCRAVGAPGPAARVRRFVLPIVRIRAVCMHRHTITRCSPLFGVCTGGACGCVDGVALQCSLRRLRRASIHVAHIQWCTGAFVDCTRWHADAHPSHLHHQCLRRCGCSAARKAAAQRTA